VSGEADEVQRRHAEYVASIAAESAVNLRGPGQLVWLRMLAREMDNVRAALAWCMAVGEARLMLQITGALHWFWMLRLPREGREWLDRALDLGRAHDLELSGDAMTALVAQADLTWAARDPDLPDLLKQGADLLELSRDGITALVAQADLAWAARDPDLPHLLTRGADLCEAARDLRGRAWFQHIRGERASVFGELDRAAPLLEASVTGFRAVHEVWEMSRALLDLAYVVDRRGDRARARALLEESLAHFRELGDRWGITQAFSALAFHTIVGGEYEQAAELAEASLTPARELNDVRSITQALILLGWLAYLRDDNRAALGRLQEALVLGRETGNQYAVARVMTMLGEWIRARQRYDWAAILYEHALAMFQEIQSEPAILGNLQNLGWTTLYLNNPTRAEALFSESLAQPSVRHRATGLSGVAAVALAHGYAERATRLLAAATADLESRDATLEYTDQVEYDRALQRARSSLDEATFAAAWDTGRAMSTDDAIADALRGAKPSLS
jgi:Tfp pilus assembly protein PilF